MERTIDWCDGVVVLVDQTMLPDEYLRLQVTTVDELVDAIARLAVRGAPALGAAGALGVALAATTTHDPDEIRRLAARVRTARPTAANLAWGVDRALARVGEGPAAVVAEACAVLDEDAATNRALGERGAELLESIRGSNADGLRILTHCNAGALACVEWGTALGIVRSLHERGSVREVMCTETRPLLQGARLTAWELRREGIAHRLIVDGAAASTLMRGLLDVVVVGADRIAANGDVANKIGTLAHALAANAGGVPFIVAAPESTIDTATATGADITIEERAAGEVAGWRNIRSAPANTPVMNPAFDVTPAELVTAVVTERRVFRPAAGERADDAPPAARRMAGDGVA